MKKFFALVFCIILSLNVAFAEIDISSMTDEELYALRQAINEELAGRANKHKSIAEGVTIAEIFPDEWLAKEIRDELGKFSTKDVVTQQELDTITRLSTQNVKALTSLEGVQYLRNLERLTVYNNPAITEFPEWICDFHNLKYLTFAHVNIDDIPERICELTNLKTLDISRTTITRLPDDIGNLINLKSLDISYTNITELPESIYNLNLTTFDRSGLDLD